MENFLILKLVLIYCSVFVIDCQNGCDRSTGPSGSIECIELPQYRNDFQWATCLTTKYIEEKTKYRFTCTDRTATYCWYQCMVNFFWSSL